MIIFVAGIHGVGKTSFCQQVAAALAFDHISASTLIQRAKQRAVERHKAVADVSQNQDILIAGLRAYKWAAPALLLDGHFCLLTKANAIEPVPIATFEQLGPVAVILLHAPIAIIQQRLQLRDSVAYSLDLLDAFQAAETQQADRVCAALDVPLFKTTSRSVTEGLDFIQRVITPQKD
ncbi:MAG: AAA family ATPase [Chloroflexales bacterium]|nr:AAA family ATPase [Chloroflexales bacterium]